MKTNLRDTLFGFRKKQNAEAAAIRKERTLATVNESDPTSTKPPRVPRTVGLTEARLRARNQESWMTSTRGWSDFFGRFTSHAKR
ncbi:MAG TPA: hypothetical protein VLJ83_09785 [Gemmatimonadaceae bacterium]|nr:hypothetical protein [Gemmatimonadaceae bacterium]